MESKKRYFQFLAGRKRKILDVSKKKLFFLSKINKGNLLEDSPNSSIHNAPQQGDLQLFDSDLLKEELSNLEAERNTNSA